MNNDDFRRHAHSFVDWMADYLEKVGIPAFSKKNKRYSTDANLAGISYEAEDLESIQTSCTIVEPQMSVWPHDAPDQPEQVSVRFEEGRAVAINVPAFSSTE